MIDVLTRKGTPLIDCAVKVGTRTRRPTVAPRVCGQWNLVAGAEGAIASPWVNGKCANVWCISISAGRFRGNCDEVALPVTVEIQEAGSRACLLPAATCWARQRHSCRIDDRVAPVPAPRIRSTIAVAIRERNRRCFRFGVGALK